VPPALQWKVEDDSSVSAAHGWNSGTNAIPLPLHASGACGNVVTGITSSLQTLVLDYSMLLGKNDESSSSAGIILMLGF
jgi:hypothetical protein